MARRRFGIIESVPRLQTAYTRYKQWQDRTEPTNYARSDSSNPGGYLRVAITAFGGVGDDKIIVKASRRANQAIGGSVGARANTTLTGAIRLPGLEPARVVCFRGTGGAASETSKITGLSYKKRTGTSYTHPFGGATATEKEMEAQAVITAALTATPNTSVSYTPERLYQV